MKRIWENPIDSPWEDQTEEFLSVREAYQVARHFRSHYGVKVKHIAEPIEDTVKTIVTCRREMDSNFSWKSLHCGSAFAVLIELPEGIHWHRNQVKLILYNLHVIISYKGTYLTECFLSDIKGDDSRPNHGLQVEVNFSALSLPQPPGAAFP